MLGHPKEGAGRGEDMTIIHCMPIRSSQKINKNILSWC